MGQESETWDDLRTQKQQEETISSHLVNGVTVCKNVRIPYPFGTHRCFFLCVCSMERGECVKIEDLKVDTWKENVKKLGFNFYKTYFRSFFYLDNLVFYILRGGRYKRVTKIQIYPYF